MSTTTYRRNEGGLIDRKKPLRFTFDGRQYMGYEGDTVASALIANGIHMVARSFKYHRPRGILGAGAEDPAALVQLGKDKARTDPNVRVTEQLLYDGLAIYSQNAWPSLNYDVGILNDLAWRFLPAGFYYKTFMGPPSKWMWFEPIIRAAAGLGVGPKEKDPDTYESTNRHCDVLVVGAGPAGLMAARAAAVSGARVILCEETSAFGGWLLSEDQEKTQLADRSPLQWVNDAMVGLEALDNVTLLKNTTAFGYYGQNFVGLWERLEDHISPEKRDASMPRQRLWRVRAKKVILATGSIERPLIFHENDRPGIMLASAAQTYAMRYGVLPGRNIVVFTNNDAAWVNAFALQDAGADIAAIVDLRQEIDTALFTRAAERSIHCFPKSVIVGTKGGKRVTSVDVRLIDEDGNLSGSAKTISCDLVAVSGGYNPNVALFSQSRGKVAYDEDLSAFKPGVSYQDEQSVGACNGSFDLTSCLKEGVTAAQNALKELGFPTAKVPSFSLRAQQKIADKVEAMWEIPSGQKVTRAWVDLQNDVTSKDLRLAAQEGYRSVEHAKRYTTTGMGTDQGKTVGVNAFGILGNAMGKTVPEVGLTTYRQPYKPVTFGAIAGNHANDLFTPRRTTAMHQWHLENGAQFETVGDWLRAWFLPQEGETWQEAVQRESKAARTGIGILDASTLGKIDVRGKDARTFLNRVYTNAWSKLAPGKCRYGLMLKEDGMVFDDGVTTCFTDDHFHMTTTTGGAAGVLKHLEDYLQTEWPDLDVYLTSVTEEWAVASICGPKSPDLVKEVFGDGFSPEEMPFMSYKETEVGGIPVRIFRISFTGEVSYEINIPAGYGRWLWDTLMSVGEKYDITPYGTETMHLLRAEKGFIIVGQETDGTITPHDLRMDWIVSQKKGDFIGKRSLYRSDTARIDRFQYVGFLTEDGDKVVDEGAQVIEKDSEDELPIPMVGHITSSYFSPNLNRSIALGVLKSGGKRLGETVYITQRGKGAPVPAKVVEVDFLGEPSAVSASPKSDDKAGEAKQ